MLPFINIFGFKIASYGALIVIGFFLGIFAAVWRAKIYNQQKDDIIYASLYAIIGLLVGAKLLYFIINISYIVDNFSNIISNSEYIISVFQNGFVFYGGLIGGVLMIYIYSKIYKIDFIELIETLVPSIPLIHAFGRLGCFYAGCCYGIPFSEPIGMMFHQSFIAPNNIALFPVQLLEAVLNIVIFLFLIIYMRKKRSKGNGISIYIIYYSVVRFIIEYVRYDAERGFLLGFSTSQWISIVLIVLVVFIKIYCKKKEHLAVV